MLLNARVCWLAVNHKTRECDALQCSRCTDSAQLGRLKADIVKSYRNGDLLVVQVNTPAVCLFRLKQYIIVKKKEKKNTFKKLSRQ